MKTVIFILSVLSFLIGIGVFAMSKSAIHEILGCVYFLISAVLLSGAVVTEAIQLLRKDLQKQSKE
jgi:uncharacterized membrane protein